MKAAVAQLVMQDARNDQIFRPVKFLSLDCFWQSAHFCFSLAHSAFAQFHCFDVRVETPLILDDIDDEGAMQDARNDQLFGLLSF